MHDRRHAAAWQDYIKSSLVSGGGRFGFALLAFFSVYRELFEVILFYETLWLQAGPAGHRRCWRVAPRRWCCWWAWLGDPAARRSAAGAVLQHQRGCCARCRWCSPGMA
jgi:high-affinity iron transporter